MRMQYQEIEKAMSRQQIYLKGEIAAVKIIATSIHTCFAHFLHVSWSTGVPSAERRQQGSLAPLVSGGRGACERLSHLNHYFSCSHAVES